MMNYLILSCFAFGIVLVCVESAIIASEDDFVVDCGTVETGPVSIKYTKQTGNTVAKIIGLNNLDTCVATETGSTGVYEISDVVNNCDATKLGQQYFIQINLREINDVVLTPEPAFLFTCQYKSGKAVATTTIADAATAPIAPTRIILEKVGDPDMTYTLNILDSDQKPLSVAKFGDDIILQVEMSGTDGDEVGSRVESCVVKSGGLNVSIVENFCVPDDKKSLAKLPGFYTNGTIAFLPLQVFALEGSTSTELEFECVVDVCSTPCEKQNCPVARKRRAADDVEPNDEMYLRMATRIQVLPVAVQSSGNQSQQSDSGSVSCMQSMGFIVTVAILGILLVLAMVVVVVLFTSRRREMQKQGA